ncbi:LacI family DNA-binding transcriptional regulator [Streptomyces europaeiscabiei]|uniref:LacI family DNA-binding transcriptional regulator n=5 Tax=Streptomyces europaeiscabiei TaxID=146819 RepID=A0ABU4N7Y3_9ACTN|nr:LacI family DNA-binding transcriptional regulator [Streptomyces europaeiscabiei]MDX2523262.1 LacI family DNA-binding transcriptional regulator [Streptomyces europaeiscabiei]MDX3542723.1 LacI family DNA-binding transcriptional regulator [Streptomyces europaeiscabiei]MDX3550567.1 LacI family DNA-binding transcriptional regulator [Streptomyces europaeiscabiei]MDX3664793.1 LacI family DNA-binding transcriptional regulator [Streptomyces europaeiscabiei]MDX3698873.1 LacI family DNA-binding transc
MSASPTPPPAPAPRVTIKDVAARAGVSKGAVSLAFNRKPGLADATRERIFAAARELGWAPNLAARSLSSQRVDVVGLAVCRPAKLLGLEPFYMEFISGVESVLTERSCSLLLRLVRNLEEEVGLQDAWWRGRQISGSILVDFRADDPRVAAVGRLGMPVVAVGHPSLTGGLTSVWTDDMTAVTEAVRYLAALGHRRIARVGGAAALGHTAIRTAAFDQVARELRLAGARQVATDFSGEAGARATRSLLTGAGGDRPTAIVYDNDIMAVAGLSVAAEMGVRVPEDVSLLAWDDSQLCRLTRPTLSAMSHDVHGFGADVARTLFDVIAGNGTSHPVATPVLVPRGSTAPAP